jgi:FkbM family methyltransferase
MNYVSVVLRLILSFFDKVIIDKSRYTFLEKQDKLAEAYLRWNSAPLPSSFIDGIINKVANGSVYSQLQQDCIASLLHSKTKEYEPFFVEVGASDGVTFSNTKFLQDLGWRGCLIEPAPTSFAKLLQNRAGENMSLFNSIVWSNDDEEIKFFEVTEGLEYSTISSLRNFDKLSQARVKGKEIIGRSKTLNSILTQCKAPKKMGFLSIDTEGSELEVLNGLNLKQWRFLFVAVEHNFNLNRDKIKSYLESNGYVCVLSEISEFDGWFVTQEQRHLFKV